MATKRVTISVGILASLLGGCQVDNPYFCCLALTPDSCLSTGADKVTPCRDPDRPYCDEEGEYGQRFSCTAEPPPIDAAPGDASEALDAP